MTVRKLLSDEWLTCITMGLFCLLTWSDPWLPCGECDETHFWSCSPKNDNETRNWTISGYIQCVYPYNQYRVCSLQGLHNYSTTWAILSWRSFCVCSSPFRLDKVSTELQGLSTTNCNFQGLSRPWINFNIQELSRTFKVRGNPVSTYILHTVFHTLLMVLTKKICVTVVMS